MNTGNEQKDPWTGWLAGAEFERTFPWAVTISLRSVIWENEPLLRRLAKHLDVKEGRLRSLKVSEVLDGDGKVRTELKGAPVSKQLRQELREHLTQLLGTNNFRWSFYLDIPVFKKPVRRPLTEEGAKKHLSVFMNKLNVRLFGRRWEKSGNGIAYIPFLGGLDSYLDLGNRNDLWWNNETAEKLNAGSRETLNIHYHLSLGPELTTHDRGRLLSEERTKDESVALLTSIDTSAPFGGGSGGIDIRPTYSDEWLGYGASQQETRWDALDADTLPNTRPD